jgi:thiopeptide-type bacteriocin biosynthesis protein
MAAPVGPKKVKRYSDEFKIQAVKLASHPDIQTQDVAQALDIHPFMLSKWKKDFRDGRLKPAANAAGLSLPKVLRTSKRDPEKAQLKRQVKQLEEKVEARAEARRLAEAVVADIHKKRVLALMLGDTSMGMINGYFGPRLLARHFQTAPFFAFRTPALPLGFLEAWSEGLASRAPGADLDATVPEDVRALGEKLKEAVRDPRVREALFLASPDLEEGLDPWLRGSLDEGRKARTDRSVVRYLSRMGSRPTPFGLFATCSLGSWGGASRLTLGPSGGNRRRTRLDMGYLTGLVEVLERDHRLRECLRYQPNTSLHAFAGRYHYAESRVGAREGLVYDQVAVEASPALGKVLALAGPGATLQELAQSLVGEEANLEEASSFIHSLIDNQVLVSNLAPSLTGPDPMETLLGHLARNPETAPLESVLKQVSRTLRAMDDRGSASPQEYRDLARGLEAISAPLSLHQLFQVDVSRPSPEATLGPRARRCLEEGVDLLRRLCPPRPEDPLARFRAAFRDRYESRFVPLLEVLDRETGIGFQHPGREPRDPSPLLQGLRFPLGEPEPRPFTSRDAHLLRRLTALGNWFEWQLTDEDLDILSHPDPVPLPDSFALVATLAAPSSEALDAGDLRVLLEGCTGPSGGRLLGRFCHLDPRLARELKDHLAAEEALRPETIFAEVVHLPEGRMGNVLRRPPLRAHEIPWLGAGSAGEEGRIPPQDLLVGLAGERVVLYSRRLGREVAPRLASAHNYGRGLELYRFLGALQDQDGGTWSWRWGRLETMPFLPRVRRGPHVLSRAQWRLEAKDVQEVLDVQGAERYRRFQALRESRWLPRLVVLADGDNELLVDLENPLWVDTLLHLVARRPFFRLVEFFPGPDQTVAAGPEGRFCHQLVVPFQRVQSRRRPTPLPTLHPAAPPHPPGSSWLYLKLYLGTSTADRFLLQALAPFLQETRGLWDRWFFLRYRDPDHHLRLRFHGDPSAMGDLLARIHTLLDPLLASGWFWKCQMDTYRPETDRYGGPPGLALAEEVFWRDSESALDLLGVSQGDPGAGLRWRLGLLATEALLEDLGLDLSSRIQTLAQALEGFAREWPGLEHQLGVRFRPVRRELETLLASPGQLEGPLDDLLERRRAALAGPLSALREAQARGEVSAGLPSLALSFTHMHLNRLFRDSQREQEYVIYDHLRRLLESRRARP